MKIFSVRLGHANNSSSTHSILLNSKREARGAEDNSYGWGWFHLRSKEDKAKYLAAQVFQELRTDMAPEHAAMIAEHLTGARSPLAGDDPFDYEGYVDHQSTLGFPRRFDRKGVHAEFMQTFVEKVRDDPRITIRGGNDNEEDPEPMPESAWDPATRLPRENRGPVARQDGDYWSLYNERTGAKVRMTFLDEAPPYEKASKPELVDIKITDFCPHGCAFCYQSSTKRGQHAEMERIRSLAYECAQAEVFEVALGGGETTLHPQFEEVLSTFASLHVTPNFTSFNMDWSKDKSKAEAALKWCKSFAMSSIDLAHVRELGEWNQKNPKVRGTLQIPLGCYPANAIMGALEIATAVHVPVTFLGYKAHGRGEKFDAHEFRWVLDHVQKRKWDRFGADSVFVDQFREDLVSLGISERLMVNREGAFSMYVDAVNWKAGASSFTDALHLVSGRNGAFERFPYV